MGVPADQSSAISAATLTARQDGLRSLREHAVRKVALGVTSFEEAVRGTADVEGWR